MDWSNPKQVSAFFDLHSGNPREGPGDKVGTARALAAVTDAADSGQIESVLDLACGPGMQTRHLAELLPCTQITALDIHQPFLDRVDDWVAREGLESRITTVRGNMAEAPVAAGSMDLIWCEGAAYILGIEPALRAWRPLLRDRGFVAFTEPVFLSAELPPAVVDNWAEYPAMTDALGVADTIAAADFELIESFNLASEAWAAYYDPLQLRVTSLLEKYANDPDGKQVIEEGQQEIDAWRNFGEYFTYAFFVARPV